MVVHHDRDSRREERVETSFVESVRVIRSENEKIDNVDDSDPQIGTEIFLELSSGADDFGLKFESNSDENDIGVDSLVDRVGFPDRNTGSAVSVCFFDREEDGSRSFGSNDEVDVVLRSETVFDDRDGSVGIGREVYSSEVRRERENGSDESRL
jgi:hypothetical protein